MIIQALQQELAGVLRSPVRLFSIALFIIASLFALFAGQRFVDSWNENLQQAEQQQTESIKTATEWLTQGIAGPADRDWVDITQPLWQDWYAGTRIMRSPSPLAAIATGSTDDSPRVMRVNRLANPFTAQGTKIENPELSLTESVDLVFIFAVFVPLLIAAIGLGCGAYERENKLDQLIAVQRGNASGWFLARSIAIALLCMGIVVLVVALCLIVTGAFNSDGLSLLGVSLLYTLLWSGIFTATAIAANSMREAALSYGGVWVLLVVLVPTIMSEQSISKYSANAELTTALEQRAAQYSGYKKEADELAIKLYSLRPELKKMPAAALSELPDEQRRHLYDFDRIQGLVVQHETNQAEERASIQQAEQTMAWSPTVTLVLAIERLAGRDLNAAIAFREKVVQAIATRGNWVVDSAWRNQKLSLEDFQALTKSNPQPEISSPINVSRHLVTLLGWVLLCWLLAIYRLRRQEVHL